jgi:hypothetical protein
MIKTVLIRTIGRPALAAACAMLCACTPYPAPVQAIPPGPTPDELAYYAAAQTQYRLGLATGNDDAVAAANETFRKIPRAIFCREYPSLFKAELVCERYRVAGPDATSRGMPILFEPQCQNIEWRYNEATHAIRRDIEARIAAANFAIIAQAAAAHP